MVQNGPQQLDLEPRHWHCVIVGPASSDLADNRIMSFPLCNLNIVAVMVKILLNMKKFSQKKKTFQWSKKEKACPSFAPTVCTHKKNGLSPLLKNIILCAITICVLEDRKSSTTLQSIIEPWNNRKKKDFLSKHYFLCNYNIV